MIYRLKLASKKYKRLARTPAAVEQQQQPTQSTVQNLLLIETKDCQSSATRSELSVDFVLPFSQLICPIGLKQGLNMREVISLNGTSTNAQKILSNYALHINKHNLTPPREQLAKPDVKLQILAGR